MARHDPHDSEKFVRETLNPSALEAELKYSADAEVRFDKTTRAIYSTDASNYRQVPVGVVLPRTKEAVEETLAICRKHGAPIVSRGGGTGLCGQSCNEAVVIDHSKYLNRIMEIDPDEKYAVVEPGTILDSLRNITQSKYNLTYGPDPATHDHNTFGGMIGNNSCGIHSVMAGRTSDNVLELEIVTYDGLRMRVGETSEDELGDIIARGGRKGEIYRRLKALTDKYADLIRKRFPDIPRRVSGYNLPDLLPENGFNVARALVGSEGTLATILEAKVRLVYSPPARALVVLGYPDVFSAGDHIPELLQFNPVGLEGMDDLLIKFMKLQKIHPEEVRLLPDGNGWLVAEFGGKDVEEARGNALRALDALKKVKNPPSMKLYYDPVEEHLLWEVRESGLGATAVVPGYPISWPGWEDAAVPVDKVGAYLREFKGLLDRHRLVASLYGHFGQGCIHCSITFDLYTHGGVQDFMRFIDEASDLVVKYGGSFSAEHGDGQSKAIFLPKMFGPELMDAFREFKSIWDPDWKMNPGKIIDAYTPAENMRLGTGYSPWQPERTYYEYLDDEGNMPRASLRCAGVGKCRRPEEVFMCPSFLATRDEMHTTRGRARILFEMFRGDFIGDRWKSDEVRESLDLCLACKGCKKECPVFVDMAMYKSEFLSHYYKGRLRPRTAYSMGLVGIWARLGSRVPGLANLLSQSALSGLTKAIGGIAGERKMPVFAAQTFTAWFRGRQAGNPPLNPDGPKVVLFPDVFNDCFYPQILKAAAADLERWGYNVNIPPEDPPAVRPLIDYGMLDKARENIIKALDTLHPFLAEGVPVVFMEPSTASVYKDEALQMMPGNIDGKRASLLTYLLSEFVEKEDLPLPRLTGRAVFHGHCHQKAVLNVGAARRVLARMGLEVAEPEPGCCGLAGSFGFEADHYAVSMDIGEKRLFPAIRTAGKDAWVITDGFSCRTQIMDGAGREPMHMAELIDYAYKAGERAEEKPEEIKKAA